MHVTDSAPTVPAHSTKHYGQIYATEHQSTQQTLFARPQAGGTHLQLHRLGWLSSPGPWSAGTLPAPSPGRSPQPAGKALLTDPGREVRHGEVWGHLLTNAVLTNRLLKFTTSSLSSPGAQFQRKEGEPERSLGEICALWTEPFWASQSPTYLSVCYCEVYARAIQGHFLLGHA